MMCLEFGSNDIFYNSIDLDQMLWMINSTLNKRDVDCKYESSKLTL